MSPRARTANAGPAATPSDQMSAGRLQLDLNREIGPPPAKVLLLGAKASANCCAVSLRKWRSMDAAGLMPRPVKLGSSVRWSLDELERWIANGCPDRATWEKIKSATRK